MSVKAFLLTVILLSMLWLNVFAGKKSVSIEILYIANTNALLENCHCGSPSLGGLARISTVVKQEKKKNPASILIDGGDFFNTYPYEELNKTVLNIYAVINPDIISTGENEFINGLSIIEPFFKKNSNKIISSNYKIDDLITRKYIRKSNMVFMSYLDKGVFLTKNNVIDFRDNQFKTLYNKNKDHFMIVLYHGYFDNLDRFIASYPQIDVVLAAHSGAGELERSGNTLIIGSGSDGEYVVKILIDKKRKVKVKLLPVNLAINQDKKVMEYVNKFKESEKKKRAIEN